jgi:WD40 repeat protein
VKATKNVAFYRADPEFNATLWIVAPGETARLLASPANGFSSAAWPAWSPDGAWVYFTGVRLNSSLRSLSRIRPDGSQLEDLGVYSRTARFERVTVSPDGSTVAIPADGGVKVINVATKTSKVLPVECHVPRYSPDGRQFGCLVNDRLAVMNADGSGLRVITLLDVPQFAANFEEVSGVDWSPDGKWLIAQNSASGLQLVRVSDGTVMGLPALRFTYTQAAFVR